MSTERILLLVGALAGSVAAAMTARGPSNWIKGSHGLTLRGNSASLKAASTDPPNHYQGFDLSAIFCRSIRLNVEEQIQSAVSDRLLHELLLCIYTTTGRRYEYVGKFNDETTWNELLRVLKALEKRSAQLYMEAKIHGS